MINRLFIYGTLGPGRPNAHVMESIGGTWEQATVTGTLRHAGWGAEHGYPGIDLGAGGTDIDGFIFTSDNLHNHWTMLDRFEGDAYERVLTKVTLVDGRQIDAYIYQLSSACGDG